MAVKIKVIRTLAEVYPHLSLEADGVAEMDVSPYPGDISWGNEDAHKALGFYRKESS